MTTSEASRTRQAGGETPAEDLVEERVTDRALADLVDGERRRVLADERRVARQRVQMDQDSATFLGALRDLAEHRRMVRLGHVGGSVAGRVVEIGADHVVVEAGRLRCFVLLSAIGTVALVESDTPPAAGPRHRDTGRPRRTMQGVLDELVQHAAQVTVHLAGHDDSVMGTARTWGQDVLTIQTTRPSGQPTFIHWKNVLRIDEHC